MSLLQEYLAESSEVRRLDILVKLKKQKADAASVSVDLAFDLLELGLPIQEQEHILDIAAAGSEKHLFEEALLEHLSLNFEPQTIVFLRKWIEHTNHTKAQKILDLFHNKHCGQRVRYIILMHSECFEGTQLLDHVSKLEGLDEFSDAFHALALSESVKYNYSSSMFTTMAVNYCNRFKEYPYPDAKALFPAITYLAKFEPTALEGVQKLGPGGLWREAIRFRLSKPDSEAPIPWADIEDLEKLDQYWPTAAKRHKLNAIAIKPLLERLCSISDKKSLSRNLLTGVDSEQLSEAFLNINESKQRKLGTLVRPWLNKTAFKVWRQLRDQNSATLAIRTPQDRSRLFDFMYRNAKNSGILKDGPWCCVASVYTLQNDFQLTNLSRLARGTTGIYRQVFIKAFGAFTNQDKAVLQLLDYVHTNRTSEQRAIVDALLQIRSPRALQELLKFTGKSGFHPQLKMRFFRSLKNLDTSLVQVQLRDSIKELESKGSQTGLSDLEIEESLDLLRSSLQSDATGIPAIPQASAPTPVNSHVKSSKPEAASRPTKSPAATIVRRAEKKPAQPTSQGTPLANPRTTPKRSGKQKPGSILHRVENNHLENYSETHIQKVIPIFGELSGEVQRSIRTGLFFYDKVRQETAGTMDLSPVIDMQYKAMEVSLREAFQAATDNLIREGVLQRKLDLLGYSRPIIEKMTKFENFISSLPTVKTIPYFSKFKLRKMLRGICQFRPGKRFTLDGLKAFALFFAVFSRQKCQYGLQNLFPLEFSEDKQLYDFVHQLHSFQDFRNRAVHEGLPPEASANLESTWTQTSQILMMIHNLSSAARKTEDEEVAKRTREPTFLKRNA